MCSFSMGWGDPLSGRSLTGPSVGIPTPALLICLAYLMPGYFWDLSNTKCVFGLLRVSVLSVGMTGAVYPRYWIFLATYQSMLRSYTTFALTLDLVSLQNLTTRGSAADVLLRVPLYIAILQHSSIIVCISQMDTHTDHITMVIRPAYSYTPSFLL